MRTYKKISLGVDFFKKYFLSKYAKNQSCYIHMGCYNTHRHAKFTFSMNLNINEESFIYYFYRLIKILYDDQSKKSID